MPGNSPPLSPTGVEAAPGAFDAFTFTIQGQAMVLTLSDCFVIIAGLAVALIVVLFILPQRTYPPRIEFAKK
jgi:DHA2 family multidrug resistance protein